MSCKFQDINGQVAGGGVSIYYSHALQLIFISYTQGKAFFFSSPEHEVLMVSYWDSAVSGVRRESCVVRRPSSTFYLVYTLEATVLVGYS